MKLIGTVFLFTLSLNLCRAQQTSRILQLNGKQKDANIITATLQHIVDTGKITGLQVVIINHSGSLSA